jgi:hypothetical protein
MPDDYSIARQAKKQLISKVFTRLQAVTHGPGSQYCKCGEQTPSRGLKAVGEPNRWRLANCDVNDDSGPVDRQLLQCYECGLMRGNDQPC